MARKQSIKSGPLDLLSKPHVFIPLIAAVAGVAAFVLVFHPGSPSMTQEVAAGSASQPPATSQREVAVIETDYGKIVFEFLPDKAPATVANFKKLANSGFYDGTAFHRVIPGFMIQGGDPNSKGDDRATYGTGGPGYTIKAEFNDVPFDRGVVGMARASDPNSAGSQFFIMVARAPSLDGQYTAFGRVVQGMDVADKIVGLPRDSRDNPLQKAVMKRVYIANQ